MEWTSGVGYNRIEFFDDYGAFEKNIVKSNAGIVDRDLSFAAIGEERIPLKEIQLLRKKRL